MLRRLDGVCDLDNGGLVLSFNAAEEHHVPCIGLAVKGSNWLVHQVRLRLGNEGAGDVAPLLLPHRKLPGRKLGPLR